jgi:hypothetical protein
VTDHHCVVIHSGSVAELIELIPSPLTSLGIKRKETIREDRDISVDINQIDKREVALES